VWMGHDCFPCPSNTSVIDFAGKPKPAWEALKEVFNSDV
jgi:beta-mannosidase